MPSDRATELVARLEAAAARLLDVIARLDDGDWHAAPVAGEWSIGRELEHVAEAAGYHRWIVRLTIGEKVGSRRPVLERRELLPQASRDEVATRLRQETNESATLIGRLSGEQLSLATRPPRARDPGLAETIERVLIGHYDAHRMGIEGKLRAIDESDGPPRSGEA
ncbi:MAG TPA: DinB family protein [Candidatus Limnocylindria bacterium]|nr:DinB family protein [Candidatus Limnocylindria bacterium]